MVVRLQTFLPNINIHILYTLLYTFFFVTDKENSFNNQSYLIPFILKILMNCKWVGEDIYLLFGGWDHVGGVIQVFQVLEKDLWTLKT